MAKLIISLKDYGPVPKYRFFGAKEREKIEASFSQYDEIELDFTDIIDISEAFADELFGKLIYKIDPTEIVKKVKFISCHVTISDRLKVALIKRIRTKDY